jgi:hypothetical protein
VRFPHGINQMQIGFDFMVSQALKSLHQKCEIEHARFSRCERAVRMLPPLIVDQPNVFFVI